MCGIVGKFSFEGKVDLPSVGSMVRSIRHRGPDQEDLYVSERGDIALGFVRLAILDLSSLGAQPMKDPSDRYVITFNGEVFNYIELRQELQSLGHTFRGNSDTEVVLSAYIQWGCAAFRRFKGMWSICIFDGYADKLVFSRDYFGIKPLYFHRAPGGISWASEQKAFVASGIPIIENTDVVADYLHYGLLDHTEQTFLKDVVTLPPGHYAEISTVRPSQGLGIKPYWVLEDEVSKLILPKSEQEQIGRFRSLLLESIDISMRSDVPVWVLLSGGIDSSAIASVLHYLHPGQEINALTVVHDDPEINEYSYVEDVVRKTGCNLEIVRIDEQRWIDELDAFVYHQDEPVASTTAINHWFLMKELNKNNIKVILSGQGVDEIHYGYIRMLMGYLFKDYVAKGHIIDFLREFFFHWKDRHNITPIHQSSGMLERIIGNKEFYFQSLKGIVPHSVAKKMKANVLEGSSGLLRQGYALRSFQPKEISSFDSLHNAMYRLLSVESIPRILKSEDRNSMAFSIEERVPFIDRDLMSYTFAVGSKMKVRDATSKWMIRESLKGILPERVRTRRSKLGFNTPEQRWILSEQYRRYAEDMNLASVLSDSPVNGKAFMDYVDSIRQGKKKYSGVVWRIYNYAMWRKKYISA